MLFKGMYYMRVFCLPIKYIGRFFQKKETP